MKDQSTAKPLFLVSIREKSNVTKAGIPDSYIERSLYLTEENLNYIKYFSTKKTILSVEPLGILWPNGTTVTEINVNTPFRSYVEVEYEVKSPFPLSEKDFEILRAQGCFMVGQEYGLIRKTWESDGIYHYLCRSVCDSGD